MSLSAIDWINSFDHSQADLVPDGLRLAESNPRWFWWPCTERFDTLKGGQQKVGPARTHLTSVVKAAMNSTGGTIVIGVKYLPDRDQLQLSGLYKDKRVSTYADETSLSYLIRDIMAALAMIEKEQIADASTDYVAKYTSINIGGSDRGFATIDVGKRTVPFLNPIPIRTGAHTNNSYPADKLGLASTTRPAVLYGRPNKYKASWSSGDTLRLDACVDPESSRMEYKYLPWYEDKPELRIKSWFEKYIPLLLSSGERSELVIGISDKTRCRLPFPAAPHDLKSLLENYLTESLTEMFPQLESPPQIEQIQLKIVDYQIQEEDLYKSANGLQGLVFYDEQVGREVLAEVKRSESTLLPLFRQPGTGTSIIPSLLDVQFVIPQTVADDPTLWGIIDKCIADGHALLEDDVDFAQCNVHQCCVSLQLPSCKGLFAAQESITANVVHSSLEPIDVIKFWDLLLYCRKQDATLTLQRFCGAHRYRVCIFGSMDSQSSALDDVIWNDRQDFTNTSSGRMVVNDINSPKVLPCSLVVTYSNKTNVPGQPNDYSTFKDQVRGYYTSSRLHESPQTIVLVFTDEPEYARLQYKVLKEFSNMSMLVFPLSKLDRLEVPTPPTGVSDDDETTITFTPSGIQTSRRAATVHEPSEDPYSTALESLDRDLAVDTQGEGDARAFLSGETALTESLLLRSERVDIDRTVTTKLSNLFSVKLIEMQQPKRKRLKEIHVSRAVMRCGLRSAVLRALDHAIRGSLSNYYTEVTPLEVTPSQNGHDCPLETFLTRTFRETSAYVVQCDVVHIKQVREKLSNRLPPTGRVLLVSQSNAPSAHDDVIFTPVFSMAEMPKFVGILQHHFPDSKAPLSDLLAEVTANPHDSWIRTIYSGVITALRGRCHLLSEVVQQLFKEDAFVDFFARLAVIDFFLGGLDRSPLRKNETVTIIDTLKREMSPYSQPAHMGLIIRNDWTRRKHPFVHPVVALKILEEICKTDKKLKDISLDFIKFFPVWSTRLLKSKMREKDEFSYLVEILFDRDVASAYELFETAVLHVNDAKQKGLLRVHQSKLLLFLREKLHDSTDEMDVLCILYMAYVLAVQANNTESARDDKAIFHECYMGLCFCYVSADKKSALECDGEGIMLTADNVLTQVERQLQAPLFWADREELNKRRNQASALREALSAKGDDERRDALQECNGHGFRLPVRKTNNGFGEYIQEWLEGVCPPVTSSLTSLKCRIARQLESSNDKEIKTFLLDERVRDWISRYSSFDSPGADPSMLT